MNNHLEEAKKYTKVCIDDLKHRHMPDEPWSIEDAVFLENLKWIQRSLEALEFESATVE